MSERERKQRVAERQGEVEEQQRRQRAWREYSDPGTGRAYYHNSLTEETTWVMPEEYRRMVEEGGPPPEEAAQAGAAGAAGEAAGEEDEPTGSALVETKGGQSAWERLGEKLRRTPIIQEILGLGAKVRVRIAAVGSWASLTRRRPAGGRDGGGQQGGGAGQAGARQAGRQGGGHSGGVGDEPEPVRAPVRFAARLPRCSPHAAAGCTACPPPWTLCLRRARWRRAFGSLALGVPGAAADCRLAVRRSAWTLLSPCTSSRRYVCCACVCA